MKWLDSNILWSNLCFINTCSKFLHINVVKKNSNITFFGGITFFPQIKTSIVFTNLLVGSLVHKIRRILLDHLLESEGTDEKCVKVIDAHLILHEQR